MIGERRRPASWRTGAPVVAAIAVLAIGVGAAWWRGGSMEPPRDVTPAAVVDAAESADEAVADPAPARGESVEPVQRRSSGHLGRIVLRVVDASGAPVVGAHASMRPNERYVPDPDWKRAASTSDAEGRVIFESVAAGHWLVVASHAERIAVGWPGTVQNVAIVAGEEGHARIVMIEPWVSGVAVRGGELLGCRVESISGGDWTFDSPGGELGDRLARRFPGAELCIWWPGNASERFRVATPRFTVLVGGRKPWVGALPLVPLREFAPLILDANQLTRDEAFGRVTFRALDVAGNACAGLVLLLDRRMHERSWRFGLAAGGERELPEGSYRAWLTCPFVEQLLQGEVEVRRGPPLTIHLGGRRLTRLQLAVVGPEAASSAQVQHTSLPKPVTLRLRRGRGSADYWMPEGTIIVNWLGSPAGTDPAADATVHEVLLATSGLLAVGGGTAATPQRLVARPQ